MSKCIGSSLVSKWQVMGAFLLDSLPLPERVPPKSCQLAHGNARVKRWSSRADRCIDCGTSERSHQAHGRCKRCDDYGRYSTEIVQLPVSQIGSDPKCLAVKSVAQRRHGGQLLSVHPHRRGDSGIIAGGGVACARFTPTGVGISWFNSSVPRVHTLRRLSSDRAKLW
jgi:hypothetical protein